MVKHSQTVRRQQPSDCLSVFDQFVGLPLNGLRLILEGVAYTCIFWIHFQNSIINVIIRLFSFTFAFSAGW